MSLQRCEELAAGADLRAAVATKMMDRLVEVRDAALDLLGSHYQETVFPWTVRLRREAGRSGRLVLEVLAEMIDEMGLKGYGLFAPIAGAVDLMELMVGEGSKKVTKGHEEDRAEAQSAQGEGIR